jgi:hypothetical protein
MVVDCPVDCPCVVRCLVRLANNKSPSPRHPVTTTNYYYYIDTRNTPNKINYQNIIRLGLTHADKFTTLTVVNELTLSLKGTNPMVNPNTKTEYPTHSTVGGYTIAYITTDAECYCGNCIADVIESDIHLLPESRIRDYDYPLDTILYQDTSEHPTLCESCSTDISN